MSEPTGRTHISHRKTRVLFVWRGARLNDVADTRPTIRVYLINRVRRLPGVAVAHFPFNREFRSGFPQTA